MEVIQHSAKAAATGVRMTERHDKQPWRKEDSIRKRLAQEEPHIVRAALCEVRGDWKFYNGVFGLPMWNDSGGCCWKCNVSMKRSRKDVGFDASWRTSSRTTVEILLSMLRSNVFGNVFAHLTKPGVFYTRGKTKLSDSNNYGL